MGEEGEENDMGSVVRLNEGMDEQIDGTNQVIWDIYMKVKNTGGR